MESINQPYVDWNENFSMDELLAKLSDVWENPDRIKRELEEIKPQLEKMVIDSVDLTLSFLPADPK
ncbi:hypothetical protein [Thermoclostridium stercorarium]|nr:hypothetical protein [Thermoclostridium stercorarium]